MNLDQPTILPYASPAGQPSSGDLLGTGTISGPDESALGSLLELTAGGRRPVTLPSGETRRFLDDGDTVIMRARCRRDGVGSCAALSCSLLS